MFQSLILRFLSSTTMASAELRIISSESTFSRVSFLILVRLIKIPMVPPVPVGAPLMSTGTFFPSFVRIVASY